jgi:hypothetical protein
MAEEGPAPTLDEQRLPPFVNLGLGGLFLLIGAAGAIALSGQNLGFIPGGPRNGHPVAGILIGPGLFLVVGAWRFRVGLRQRRARVGAFAGTASLLGRILACILLCIVTIVAAAVVRSCR